MTIYIAIQMLFYNSIFLSLLLRPFYILFIIKCISERGNEDENKHISTYELNSRRGKKLE